MRNHILMILFQQIYPGRAAAGKHRQTLRFFGKAAHKLGRFFDDGQIGAEVGVKNAFEAHAPKSGISLSGQVFAEFITEFFTDRHPNCRRNLNNGIEAVVVEHVPHFLSLVIFDDGAGGTMGGTLTAFNAGTVGEVDTVGGGHASGQAAVEVTQRPYVLLILTDFDTTAAKDALA